MRNWSRTDIRALLTAAFLILALSLILRWPASTDPLYQGHSADYWLAQSARFTATNVNNWMFAADRLTALNALADSAIPLLIVRLDAHQTPYAKIHHVLATNAPLLTGFLPRPEFPTANDALLARREAAALLSRVPFRHANEVSVTASTVDAALFHALWNTDSRVRFWAASGLRDAGHLDKAKVLARMIQLLADPDERVHEPAAAALIPFGPAAAPAVPALIKNLQTDEPYSHQVAALFHALAAIGPAALPAVPRLRETLSDSDPSVQLAAAQALWSIVQDTTNTVPIFITALASRDGNTQTNAAAALEEIGPRATNAIPALLTGLTDEEARVRAACAAALRAISPQSLATAPTPVIIPPSHFTDADTFNFTNSGSRTTRGYRTYGLTQPVY